MSLKYSCSTRLLLIILIIFCIKQAFLLVTDTEDDIILIEENIETIDLAGDSDEERRLVIEEDRGPCVDTNLGVNHKQKRTTERLDYILNRQFKESENNIDGRMHSEIAEFVNTREDNSNDRTEVNCKLSGNLLENANSSPNSLRSTKMLMMKHDIQKQLKYIEDQENKLNSILASFPADHVDRHSLKWRNRNMCLRLKQVLIEQQNAIFGQEKKSSNAGFGSGTHSKYVSEENPSQNSNEVIEQEPNIAVYDNRSKENCNENNNGTMIKESVNQNIDSTSTLDNPSQENENSTVGNPTKLVDTTPIAEGAYHDIDTGPTVSVLEKLDPRNMRARIIFEDEDDDHDFYFELGDNGAVDSSTKYGDPNNQTNVINIIDRASNSGEARDVSECVNPYMSHSCSQDSAQEQVVSNNSMLLDKNKIEQVAYVKELIKESVEELTSFKNKLIIEQKQVIEGFSIKAAINDNQVHVAKKDRSDINQRINNPIVIRRMSEHDHTYTKMKSVNNSVNQSNNQIDENKFSDPNGCNNVNVVVENKSGNIKANVINVLLHATMQNTNARDTEIHSVNKERNIPKNKDISPSSDMNQTIENHIQLEHEQCSVSQELKKYLNKTFNSEPKLDQSEPNISDGVHKSRVDRSDANTENNDLNPELLELEPLNSNINSKLNYVKESSSGTRICWDLNEIGDSEHSEMSAGEKNLQEGEIGECHFGNSLSTTI